MERKKGVIYTWRRMHNASNIILGNSTKYCASFCIPINSLYNIVFFVTRSLRGNCWYAREYGTSWVRNKIDLSAPFNLGRVHLYRGGSWYTHSQHPPINPNRVDAATQLCMTPWSVGSRYRAMDTCTDRVKWRQKGEMRGSDGRSKLCS